LREQPDGSNSAVVRHREPNGEIMDTYKLPTQNALCNNIALLNNGSFAVEAFVIGTVSTREREEPVRIQPLLKSAATAL
jgi:hypothetical protein